MTLGMIFWLIVCAAVGAVAIFAATKPMLRKDCTLLEASIATLAGTIAIYCLLGVMLVVHVPFLQEIGLLFFIVPVTGAWTLMNWNPFSWALVQALISFILASLMHRAIMRNSQKSRDDTEQRP